MSTERVPLELDHSRWMTLALAQADLAASAGDVPVGCVIVDALGSVVGLGHNQREQLQDPTAHAELIALRAAASTIGFWRLCDTTAYVTLEPCPMCAGALVNARVARVVYGCDDPKAGAVRSLFQLATDPRLNHQLEVVSGVMAEDCAQRLRSFFAVLRSAGKK